jgi:hypothetical protein
MVVLWLVENSRDSQTIVFHLLTDDSDRIFLVSVPYQGLPRFPVGERGILEFRHLEMRDQGSRLEDAFVWYVSVGMDG